MPVNRANSMAIILFLMKQVASIPPESISAPAPDGMVRLVRHHLTKIVIKQSIPQCFTKSQHFSDLLGDVTAL